MNRFSDEAGSLARKYDSVEAAHFDLTDDRSHGCEEVAEAADIAYREVDESLRRVKVPEVVREYVRRVLEVADGLYEE